jgi:hypothetical protein
MGEYARSLLSGVFVHQDVGLGIARQPRERRLPVPEREIAQIFDRNRWSPSLGAPTQVHAIVFNQIECVGEGPRFVPPLGDAAPRSVTSRPARSQPPPVNREALGLINSAAAAIDA